MLMTFWVILYLIFFKQGWLDFCRKNDIHRSEQFWSNKKESEVCIRLDPLILTITSQILWFWGRDLKHCRRAERCFCCPYNWQAMGMAYIPEWEQTSSTGCWGNCSIPLLGSQIPKKLILEHKQDIKSSYLVKKLADIITRPCKSISIVSQIH